MPYVSRAQQRAMYAAAEGHSTLGIPKKVGAKFVAAGPAKAKLPARAPRPSEKLHAQGASEAQNRATARAALSHDAFNALDHGRGDHMAGRTGKRY